MAPRLCWGVKSTAKDQTRDAEEPCVAGGGEKPELDDPGGGGPFVCRHRGDRSCAATWPRCSLRPVAKPMPSWMVDELSWLSQRRDNGMPWLAHSAGMCIRIAGNRALCNVPDARPCHDMPCLRRFETSPCAIWTACGLDPRKRNSITQHIAKFCCACQHPSGNIAPKSRLALGAPTTHGVAGRWVRYGQGVRA